MKKFLEITGCACAVAIMLAGASITTKEPEVEEIAQPIEIIETIKPEVNVVRLLEEEVKYTAYWNEEENEDTTIQISQKDADRLLRIATAEAGNQGVTGMLKVMQVVINRVNSPDYPNTIEEVITDKNQFQTVNNGSYYAAVPTPEAHHALAELEKNLSMDKQIIAFEVSSNSKSLERYFSYIYTHGDHDFYTVKQEGE